MIVYQTDYTGDGRFVGAIEADPDPLNEGEFLIPAGAIAVMPPDAEAPAYARWTGVEWEIVTPPEPAPEQELPPREPDENDYRRAIQRLIDAHAQSRRYDSGKSLATYVTSSNPSWAAEAQAFVVWRDAVWAYAYAELDKVLSGERDQPGVDALVGELPELVWPNP